MSKLYFPGENAAVDIIAFLLDKKNLPQVVLITRKTGGKVALPGGFIDNGETPKKSAARELMEETNIPVSPYQLQALTKRGGKGTMRDPRDTQESWVTTQPYAIFLTQDQANQAKAKDDAASVEIIPLTEALQKINYADHKEILTEAQTWLRTHKKNPEPDSLEP